MNVVEPTFHQVNEWEWIAEGIVPGSCFWIEDYLWLDAEANDALRNFAWPHDIKCVGWKHDSFLIHVDDDDAETR